VCLENYFHGIVCDFMWKLVIYCSVMSLWFPVHRYLAWALDTNLEERAKVTVCMLKT